MPFAPHYAFSAHPPLLLHPKVPRPWALDMYSMVSGCLYAGFMSTNNMSTFMAMTQTDVQYRYKMKVGVVK